MKCLPKWLRGQFKWKCSLTYLPYHWGALFATVFSRWKSLFLTIVNTIFKWVVNIRKLSSFVQNNLSALFISHLILCNSLFFSHLFSLSTRITQSLQYCSNPQTLQVFLLHLRMKSLCFALDWLTRWDWRQTAWVFWSIAADAYSKILI